MDPDWRTLRIDVKRLMGDTAQLSQMGGSASGRMSRPSLSAADMQVRAWFQQKITAAGLAYRLDSAGNQSAYLPCGPVEAPTLLFGSHLDSSASGSRPDGALGMMAALEVLRLVKSSALKLPVNLEAVNFTDGGNSLAGFLGSRAAAGSLTAEHLQNPKCGRSLLEERIKTAGLTMEGFLEAHRPKSSLAGYLELQLEPGLSLHKAGIEVGVVNQIAGSCAYRLTFRGREDLSGITPIPDRLDAGLGASSFNLAAHELIARDYRGCTVNIGQLVFEPGEFDIVPNQAVLSLVFSSADARQLVDMEMDLLKAARTHAIRFGLLVRSEPLWTDAPQRMADRIQKAFTNAAEGLNLSTQSLSLGMGTDAQIMASACPAGMILIPSMESASPASRYQARDPDGIHGANVLLQAALEYASGEIKS